MTTSGADCCAAGVAGPAAAAAERAERRLLAPGVLWLALFTFVPAALVVAISFAGAGRPVAWELDASAWSRLFDARWLAAFGRSLVMAAATTAICAAVGIPLAWFAARRGPRMKQVVTFAVMIPLWANTLALLCAWKMILSRGGVADGVARTLGFVADDAFLDLLYTPSAVLLGLVYSYLPYMVWSAFQSIERFDMRLLEAAQDLGATRTESLVRVMLPVVRPGIIAGAVLVFVPSLAAFVVPHILGGGKTSYIGNVVRDRFYQDPQDWPLGAAIATALLLVTGLAAWVWFRFGEGAKRG